MSWSNSCRQNNAHEQFCTECGKHYYPNLSRLPSLPRPNEDIDKLPSSSEATSLCLRDTGTYSDGNVSLSRKRNTPTGQTVRMLMFVLLCTVSHTGHESIIVRVTFVVVISYRCYNILFHPGYILSSAVTCSRGPHAGCITFERKTKRQKSCVQSRCLTQDYGKILTWGRHHGRR